MKTISIINLKGGVAKTISAINIAHIMATRHGKRVLLVDNDKQGNTTKFFCQQSPWPGDTIAELLTDRDIKPENAIVGTGYENLRLIPADMGLITANRQLMLDSTRLQQTRLKKALGQVSGDYDYCIIDNAPDIALNTINALVASDYVLIPVKLDQFVLEGLEILTDSIAEVQENFNSGLSLLGCFITMYHNERNRDNGQFYGDAVREIERITRTKPFGIRVNRSPKVDESTYAGKPIVEYSRQSAAAYGYLDLTKYIIKRIERV